MQYKNAFTMIELIFVIVVIGILGAIAIPKLSVTRDDAFDAKDCKNTAVCITDLLAEYTAKGTATKSDSTACTRAEASMHNSITFTVTSQDISVNGAPSRCSHLNTTFKFGGLSVSI